MGVFIRRGTMGVVLTVTMALAAAGVAQAAWSGAGANARGRYNHTATMLTDGRVLVAGGNDAGALAGAQLYDPAHNAWSDAAPMSIARRGHAAVRLDSGKVLVAGGSAADGDSPGGYTRTAEVYDPAAGTWSPTGSMSTGRFQPTMTVLDDGRVLVAGGAGDVTTNQGVQSAVSLAGAEIYDPTTGTWSDTDPMSVPRAMATATLLESGKVLVAGGYDNATGELRTAELYDPADGTWSPTGSLAHARDSATATELSGGHVLVAGGDGGEGSALQSAELYEPEAGTWHATASMAGGRQTAAAARLADGTVLVAGGEDARLGRPLATTERYDPAADAWTDGGPMTAARKQHTLTALDDGRALVVGGNAGGFDVGLAGGDRFSTVTATLTAAAFGSPLVGTPSGVVSSVLTNTGDKPLGVTGVSVTGAHAGDFEVVSQSCAASPVLPGQTCEVRMRFTPGAAGARTATLAVADDSTAAGSTTAALTGTGQAPAAPAPGGTGSGGGAPAGAGPQAGTAAGGGRAGTGAGSRPAAPAAGTRPGSQAVRGTSARASCKVRTTRSRGRRRSTVTCSVTAPTRSTMALRARLMRGRTVLATARTTARSGRARLRLPARTLRRGRYTVVIARTNGTVLVRRSLRVR